MCGKAGSEWEACVRKTLFELPVNEAQQALFEQIQAQHRAHWQNYLDRGKARCADAATY
jgi:hypothetical protein